MNKGVDLSSYNNDWYKVGKNKAVVLLWYIVNAVIFKSYAFPFSFFKRGLLRLFGAELGAGVVIKPAVNIKYPWKLKLGDYTWIGEEVWIDNLAEVRIGKNVCLSQGAFLLCGNHNYSKTTFDLMLLPIVLEDGAWIGAKSVIAPGSVIKSHAVISAASFFSGEADAFGIYAGNPAVKVKKREVN